MGWFAHPIPNMSVVWWNFIWVPRIQSTWCSECSSLQQALPRIVVPISFNNPFRKVQNACAWWTLMHAMLDQGPHILSTSVNPISLGFHHRLYVFYFNVLCFALSQV
jgi:hypothetical protein